MSTYAKVGGGERGAGEEGGWSLGEQSQERPGKGGKQDLQEESQGRKWKNFKAIICCIFTAYHSAKNLYPAKFYYFHLTSTEAKRKFYT